ncbi:V-set and transmembrane domain-containing protein 4a isoform X1 [Osmerus eperlanus]|uniref:V-set and transmembrane domain-containing protein 4a isoform X1 n=1 Tax=Osmerus eperlanus TaxID=29151 RepID=UPI002E15C170
MNTFFVAVLVQMHVLLTGVCEALNVTVTPAPVVMVTEGANLTLSCLVSQRKRVNSLLVLRWLYSPPPPLPPPSPPLPPLPPPPSPPPLQPPEVLIVKVTMKRTKLYGNFTRRFPQRKFHLYEEVEGEVYRLSVLNVTGTDGGCYTCRVQEIRKHRNIWRASSNGTAATHLTVHVTPEESSSEGVWRMFEDVYLCAVLICSLGLLSMFLFTLVLACQYLHTRHRLKAASYYLVKSPDSSSGETVTSSISSSSSSPGTHRKELRHKKQERRDKSNVLREPEERPPYILTKAPAISHRPRKPRRLKNKPQRSITPRVCETDTLTYAELELVRPKPVEPSSPPATTASAPAPASPSLASPASSPDTIYAQILFQEKQM